MAEEKKILIVEDSFTIRYEIRLMLKETGIKLVQTVREMDIAGYLIKPIKFVHRLIQKCFLPFEIMAAVLILLIAERLGRSFRNVIVKGVFDI